MKNERLLLAARQCVATQLRRATRAVANLYDGVMAPSGLEGTQFTMLVTLSLAGEMPMGRLAERLGVDRTTLTRNLGPLERNAWVESAPGPDRRVRLVRLTAAGTRVLEAALPLWQSAQQQVVTSLGKSRSNDLLGLLKDVEKVSK
jgi:DNA-binding MarR family transcriptional regulator